MAFDEKLAQRVRELLVDRAVHFEEKRMMGGLCLMVDGKMCLGVAKDRLMARIGPDAYESALRQKGCRPMDFTGRPMPGFVFVTPEGTKSRTQLQARIALALEFNPRARASRKRRSTSTIGRTTKTVRRSARLTETMEKP